MGGYKYVAFIVMFECYLSFGAICLFIVCLSLEIPLEALDHLSNIERNYNYENILNVFKILVVY